MHLQYCISSRPEIICKFSNLNFLKSIVPDAAPQKSTHFITALDICGMLAHFFLSLFTRIVSHFDTERIVGESALLTSFISTLFFLGLRIFFQRHTLVMVLLFPLFALPLPHFHCAGVLERQRHFASPCTHLFNKILHVSSIKNFKIILSFKKMPLLSCVTDVCHSLVHICFLNKHFESIARLSFACTIVLSANCAR
uniref:Uncharacterized protein n=1 Tax=Rhipicephalus microplus TaxID=6941 RepID=A0A6G5AGQ6_RHIMP